MGKIIKVKVIDTSSFEETEVYINTDHIVFIEPMKETYLMVLVGDKRYPLIESIDELLEKLK